MSLIYYSESQEYIPYYYWQFNYDASGPANGNFFSKAIWIICLTSFFPSVFTSHSASNSRVSEVSKIILTFCMMSETRWMAVENFGILQ